MIKPRKLARENRIVQASIKEQFDIKAFKKKLCKVCRYKFKTCRFNLLPVTTQGEDCPYYEAR